MISSGENILKGAKGLFLFILAVVSLCSTQNHAQLTLNSFNNFISHTNFNPADNIEPLMLLSMEWNIADFLFSGLDTDSQADTAYFVEAPLIYPSPLRIQDGGWLGYGLSRNDIDLELRIYDMYGYEIIRKEFTKNSIGGFLGYNRVTLDAEFFNFKPLPAGVYFFVFVNEGEFFGKTKFAVAP